MKSRFNGVAGGAVLFLPSKILEGIIGIFTLSYTTRALSVGAYKDFATINTIVLFAYLLLVSWIGNSMTRYVGDNSENKSFYTTGTSLWFVINIFAYIAAFAVYYISGSDMWLMACMMFTATSIYQISLNMLVQTGKRIESVVLSLVSALIKPFIIFIACSFFALGTSSALPAVLAYMLSELLMGLIAVIILKMPKYIRIKSFSSEMAQNFFSYGFPLIGVSLSVGLLNFVDRFILILFNADFGIYSANNSIANSVFTMVMVGIMRAVYPSALEAYRKGGFPSAKPIISSGARLYMLIAMPAAAGLCGISKSLSGLLFSPNYIVGFPVIGLTACAMFFTGLTEYAIKAWEMSGDTKPIMQNAVAALVIKIILSVLLLPRYGIWGAALGSLIAFALYFFLSAIRVRKIMLFSVGVRHIFNISLAAILCGVTALAVTSLISSNILGLACAIASGGIVYCLVLLLTGEIKDDIRKIKAKISDIIQ